MTLWVNFNKIFNKKIFILNLFKIVIQQLTDLPDRCMFQQHFLSLLQGIDPSQYWLKTQKSILLTNLKSTRLAQIKPKKMFPILTQKMPEILAIQQKSATGLINTRKYLFNASTNQLPKQSAINMLYLLKICKRIQVVFVLKKAEFMAADNKEIYDILKYFSQIFKSEQDGPVFSQFCDCIGFAIEDAPNLAALQEYISKLKSIKNVSGYGQLILKNVIDKKRVILTNTQRPLNQFILQINSKLKQFTTHPDNLHKILNYLLNQQQIQWLNQNIESHYVGKVENIINQIKEGLMQNQIFSQDEQERQKIVQKIKQQLSKYRTLPIKKKNLAKKADNFAIQHGYYILTQFSNIEDQYYKKSNGQNVQININSRDWNDQSITNKSVAGDTLSHMFSQISLFYDQSMCQLANYLHAFYRIFQFVPNNIIQSTQSDMANNLLQIVENLITIIHNNLNDLIEDLKLKQQWTVPSKKLLGLAHMIQNYIKKLKQFLSRDRDPFKKLKQQIDEILIYIYQLFFFCSWKCYKRYQKFWSNGQKNQFFCDLYDIAFKCKNSPYKSMLKGKRLSQCSNIICKIDQYFGIVYQKKKQFYIAINFFIVGKMDWKVINCCNLWLKNILQSNQTQANIKNIHQCFNILVERGMIEEARRWCYKFMETVQENSQFIIFLQSIISSQINEKVMKEHISFLLNDSSILVDQQIFKEVYKQLKKQQWLFQN